MYDPPHLLKCTRNNLKNHDIEIDGVKVSWKHIFNFYKKDRLMDIRLAPKLTPKHIIENNFQKMKVCLAAQVFSRSVAAGMYLHILFNSLPPEAIHTIKFIKQIDRLFDCFNSESEFCLNMYKKSLSELSVHKQFLGEMRQYIASWTIGNNPLNNFPFHKGWLISITSLLMLWDDLRDNYGFTSINTRRLNQDPLENLFGVSRMSSGCDKNPKVSCFDPIMRKLTMTTLLEPPESANCIKDLDEILLSCSDLLKEGLPDQSTLDTTRNDDPIIPEFSRSDYEMHLKDCPSTESMCDITQESISENALYYFSGYLAFTHLKRHKCSKCQESLLIADRSSLTMMQQTFTALKAYVPNAKSVVSGLKLATMDFFQFVKCLDSKFTTIFTQHCHKQNVGKLIFDDYMRYVLPSTAFNLCSNDYLHVLVKFYIRCKIYFAVRMHNRRSGKSITCAKSTRKSRKAASSKVMKPIINLISLILIIGLFIIIL